MSRMGRDGVHYQKLGNAVYCQRERNVAYVARHTTTGGIRRKTRESQWDEFFDVRDLLNRLRRERVIISSNSIGARHKKGSP